MLAKTKYLLIIVALVVATSACAPLQTSSGPAAPVDSRSAPASPGFPGTAETEPVEKTSPKKIAPAEQVASPAHKAVSALLQEGWSYYRAENYDRSIAIAERAQRLNPRRAEVYLLLAKSYFASGQSQLAEQLSQRGLSFSQSDVTIRRKLQRLLVQIRGAVL
ncbi:hypothetical protein A9Q88_03955 [Gammaproteobacteria bacterium 50_400_T64]|nr:hypothetical protein A9Q88_03955 [Gammaproteobacteria bacterium 50_400_T64]